MNIQETALLASDLVAGVIPDGTQYILVIHNPNAGPNQSDTGIATNIHDNPIHLCSLMKNGGDKIAAAFDLVAKGGQYEAASGYTYSPLPGNERN